ncbi:MAG: DUF2283 domain-containing protein [Gemmatimonadota bacterium]
MKIAYDKAADALYIRLKEGVHQCRVVRLSEDIAVDFGAEDTPVGDAVDCHFEEGDRPRMILLYP